MKKRLLISSVLMSAVLACALGTGTYAWYKVSNTTKPTATAVSGSVGALTPTTTIGDLTFTIALSGTGVTSDANGYKLPAVDLTDTTGASKYYVNETTKPDYVPAKASGSFTVTVTASLTEAKDLANYAGDYVFEVTSAGWAKVGEAATVEGLYGVSKDTDKVSFTVNISPAGAITGNTKVVHYAVQNSTEGIEAEDAHNSDTITVSLKTE